MDLQIIQLNRILHDEQYKKAERYHQGLKYGAYHTLLKRSQSFLMKSYLALTARTGKLNSQCCSESGLQPTNPKTQNC